MDPSTSCGVEDYVPYYDDSVDVVVFEGACRPPKASHPLWLGRTQLVLSDRGMRGKLPEGWWSHSQVIAHSETGGVTDWEGRSHWFAKTSRHGRKPSHANYVFDDRFIRGAPNLLINLVDRTVSGKRTRESLGEKQLDPGKDLLPWDHVAVFRKKRLVLPKVYGQNVQVQGHLPLESCRLVSTCQYPWCRIGMTLRSRPSS